MNQFSRRAHELFQELKDASDAERESRLNEVAQDEPELYGEVESLLSEIGQATTPASDKGHADYETIEQTTDLGRRKRTPQVDESPPEIPGYEISEPLGRGGMGVVWRALQVSTQREVALKLSSAANVRSSKMVARFEREVELAARLVHPNIARVYDSGVCDGAPYYAMELIDGDNLDRYVASAGLDDRRIIELMLPICSAMQHAHQMGVIHRDLKPSNILVSTEGSPYVVDFGLARTILNETDPTQVHVTQQGQLLGTLAYMSPEQATGDADRLDTRTDVFSLGVILYQLLTGESPHKMSGSRLSVIRRIAEDDVRWPRTVKASIDRDVESIMLRALDRERDRRYATAGELGADLQRFLNGEPIVARPIGPFARAAKWARRRPAVASLLGLVFLIACLGLAGVFWQWNAAVVARELADRRGKAAVEARDLADSRAAAEKAARVSEQAARQEEAKQRAAAESTLYFSRIALARREWQANDVARALQILELCKPLSGRPDLRGWEWRYLNRICHAELFRTAAHNDWVYDVVYSQDGKLVATAGGGNPYFETQTNSIEPGDVKLWDARTGNVLHMLKGHEHQVVQVAFSPDSRQLASCGYDGKVVVWDTESGQHKQTCEGHRDWVTCLAYSPDGARLASASKDGTVRLWDPQTGAELATYEMHTELIRQIAFGPEGRWLVSGGNDDSVVLWDTAADAGSAGKRLGRHEADITCLAFSPNGTLFASGANDRSVRVWDAASGAEVRRLDCTSNVQSLAFSRGGHRLAAGCSDGEIFVWDAESGDVAHILRGHSGDVPSLSFSPDDRSLASAGADNTVRSWAIDEGGMSVVYRGHVSRVTAVAHHPNGAQLASAGQDGGLRFWDRTRDVEQLEVPTKMRFINQLCVLDDGQHFSTLDATGQLDVRHASLGTLQHSSRVGSHPFIRFPMIEQTYSNNGHWVAARSGADATNVKIWETKSGKELLTLDDHAKRISCIAIAPSGKRVAAVAKEGPLPLDLKVWDVTTDSDGALTGQSEVVMSAELRPVACRSVSFDPAGSLVATAGDDGVVEVYDVASGKVVHRLGGSTEDGLDGLVTCVTFSPKSDLLAACYFYGSDVLIWNVETGEQIARLPAPPRLTHAAFHPDGTRLAAVNMDCTITLWDSSTWREAFTLKGMDRPRTQDFGVNCRVAFSPDGALILANDVDAVVHIWNAAPAAGDEMQRRLAEAEQRAPLWHLTQAEQASLAKQLSAAHLHLSRTSDEADLSIAGRRGALLAIWGEREQAKAAFASGLERDPKNSMNYRRLAFLQLRDEDFEGYRETCRRMVETLTADSAALQGEVAKDVARALSLDQDGGESKLLAGLAHKILSLSPQEMYWMGLRALSSYREGKYADARRRVNIAMQGDSSSTSAAHWALLALIEHQELQPDAAQAALEVAKRLHREGGKQRWELAVELECRIAEADRVLQETEAQVRRRHESRLKTLAEQIDAEPTRLELRQQRTRLLGLLGRWDEAKREYDAAIAKGAGERAALLFSGEGEYLATPHIAFDDYDAFTIETWVKGWSGAVVQQGPWSGQESAIWMALRTWASCGWKHNGKAFRGPVPRELPTDWMHLAMVFDGRKLNIYLHGKLVFSQDAEGPKGHRQERPLMIAKYVDATEWDGSGLFNSVRITSRARYSADFEPPQKLEADDGTELLLDAAHAKGTVIPDLSPHQRDGKIHDAWWLPPESES